MHRIVEDGSTEPQAFQEAMVAQIFPYLQQPPAQLKTPSTEYPARPEPARMVLVRDVTF